MKKQALTLSWVSIIRLGLVQTALGAIVVMTTSALNRIMVVELALPALIPGALVTLHHAMQMLRPRMGHGSDGGKRRTPWIAGGMAVLAVGGAGASVATAIMGSHFRIGMPLAVVSFALIGAGVSSAGTSLLTLMAKRVADERRAAAATTVWMMMIAGFAITATVAGKLLDPFSPARLVMVGVGVCVAALILAFVSLWGVEGDGPDLASAAEERAKPPFRAVLKEVWAEPDARRFTIFVFVSMLAYSAQDLILEPFAGAFFGFSPGASTRLSGTQHGGVFAGMLLVAIVTSLAKGTRLASLKGWVVGGCVTSAISMMGLVWAGLHGGSWPLKENVFLLGVANGVFASASIAAMMHLAGRTSGATGRTGREGMRMGIWGAAQAIAFGGGGFLGTMIVDISKHWVGANGAAYAVVFALEAVGFFVAHRLALKTSFGASPARDVLVLLPTPASKSA